MTSQHQWWDLIGTKYRFKWPRMLNIENLTGIGNFHLLVSQNLKIEWRTRCGSSNHLMSFPKLMLVLVRSSTNSAYILLSRSPKQDSNFLKDPSAPQLTKTTTRKTPPGQSISPFAPKLPWRAAYLWDCSLCCTSIGETWVRLSTVVWNEFYYTICK